MQSDIAGKCMDVNGADTADGTAVQVRSCGDEVNKFWSAYTDGTVRTMGECLDAAGAGTANGTKAQIWSCNGGSNQKWTTLTAG